MSDLAARQFRHMGTRTTQGYSRRMTGQHGFGLIEMLISMALSLLAVSVMVILMANTLGSGSQTIQMSRLSQELRASMQLMSRDLRRANYHRDFLNCFANSDCRDDLGITEYVNTIHINAAGNCFWYWLDRDNDGDLSNDAVGGFRYSTVGGIGVIQMRISKNDAADCDSDDDWELITDPNTVEITNFIVSNTDSYTETLSHTGDEQVVEKIRLSIYGQMTTNPSVQREIQDLIQIRNEIQTTGA